MGGMNSGSGWIQRVVAPWSYRDGNVLNAIVDPMNLTSWDEGKVANFGAGSKDTYDQTTPVEEVVAIPEDPAIAAQAVSEQARQEEMRKRRLRTKTLLSDQEDTGTATVGTKVLLGG